MEVFLIAPSPLHKLSGTFSNGYFKAFSKLICLPSFSEMLHSIAKISLLTSTYALPFFKDVFFAMLLKP